MTTYKSMSRREAAKNISDMRQFARKATSSKEEAIRVLKKAGILTETGEVADPYKDLLRPRS